jgi:hypothetical protein
MTDKNLVSVDFHVRVVVQVVELSVVEFGKNIGRRDVSEFSQMLHRIIPGMRVILFTVNRDFDLPLFVMFVSAMDVAMVTDADVAQPMITVMMFFIDKQFQFGVAFWRCLSEQLIDCFLIFDCDGFRLSVRVNKHFNFLGHNPPG